MLNCVYTYTHREWNIIQPYKIIEILLFEARWMDLKFIILSEVSQTKKCKYYMITLMCESKNNTNELICKTNRLTNIANKLTVTKGERG